MAEHAPERRAGGRRPAGGNRHRQRAREQVQASRRVAFDVVRAVSADDAYANLALPAAIARARLGQADAALATELCYGTLRMRDYYDRVIAIAAGRRVDTIDAPLLDVLRLGAHQLLATRVAPHAAVNESVALARDAVSGTVTGFANGVLRAIGRSSPEEWRERVLDAANGADDRLSAEFSHPAWIVRALRRSLTAEGRADELRDLLDADNRAPAVNLVALPGLATRPDRSTANRFSPVGFTTGGGDPDELVRPSAGRLRVQDEGSQLVALALTRARPVRPGERWLDLCAGPGGKTALLAAEALAGGAGLVANEPVPARAALVRHAVEPIPIDVDVTEIDGTRLPDVDDARLAGGFDRILIDAPCTGLGALRRRPEARWRKQPADVATLTSVQRQLVDAALARLAPGGILAYVTCSPHIAETRGIVADVLAANRGRVRLLDTAAVVQTVAREHLDLGESFLGADQRDAVTSDGGSTVQLWPHRHGTDAMFIALLSVE